jgi:N-dimethylarginine dimethylaminohydrolase
MELTATEMEHMHGNVLSIAPHVVISSIGFERTFNQMKRWGYDVILVDLTETAKMGGLLRCSTMPLRRQPTHT